MAFVESRLVMYSPRRREPSTVNFLSKESQVMLKKMVYKLLHFFGYELYKFPSPDDIARLKEEETIKWEQEQIKKR